MKLPSLHPGRSEFSPIRRDGGLYVDKTDHLRKLLVSAGGNGSHLHTQYAFLARPRRFGQTLLVSTLEAYFQGDLPKSGPGDSGAFDPNAGQRVDLFRGTAIEDDVRRTRVHPVVRLNMAMATSDTPAGLQAKLLEHLERLYTDWHRRGVETDIEPRKAGGYIRFPLPAAWIPCCMNLEGNSGRPRWFWLTSTMHLSRICWAGTWTRNRSSRF